MTKSGRTTGTQVQFDIPEQIDKAIESLTIKVPEVPHKGSQSAESCLHVDDLFCVGDKELYHHVVSAIQKDYQIASERHK